jgi:hypothetical protein
MGQTQAGTVGFLMQTQVTGELSAFALQTGSSARQPTGKFLSGSAKTLSSNMGPPTHTSPSVLGTEPQV